MALSCFNPFTISEHFSTICEREGKNPSDVPLEDIVMDLLSYFNGFTCLHEAETDIETQCRIQRQPGQFCWPVDDIKRAWVKTHHMDLKSRRRKHWTRVILLQMLKLSLHHGGFRGQESQSSLEEAEDKVKNEQESTNDNERKAQNIKPNPAGRSPQIMELEMNETALMNETPSGMCGSSQDQPDQSGSRTGGKKRPLSNRDNAESLNLHSTSSERGDEKIKAKRSDNPMEKGEDGQWRRRNSSTSKSGTVYVRIPFSIISANESNSIPDVVSNGIDTYKLIDTVPNLTEIRRKKSYAMLYDNRTRNAAWVFEILNKETLKQEPVKEGCFKPDWTIHPFFQAPESERCNDSGYARGHLAAAANHRWCQEASDDTYLLSNMAPQRTELNNGIWKSLETQCRKLAKQTDIRNVHVYTGPLYLPRNENSEDESYSEDVSYEMLGDKAVPTHFFKIVIKEFNNDKVELLCFKMPNDDSIDNNYTSGLDPLDDLHSRYGEDVHNIERHTGLIFTQSRCYEGEMVNKTVKWWGDDDDEYSVTAEVRIFMPLTDDSDCVTSDVYSSLLYNSHHTETQSDFCMIPYGCSLMY